jgi:AraC-like DNA-binding protein
MNSNPYLVVQTDPSGSMHVNLLEGVQEEAQRCLFPHTICHIGQSWPRSMENTNCQGLIRSLYSPDAVQGLSFPVINFSNTAGPIDGIGNVLNDDVAIGRLAAQHLLKLGHRHFLALGWSRRRFSVERIEGFRMEVLAAGAEVEELDVPQDPRVYGQQDWSPLSYLNGVAGELAPVLNALPPDSALFGVNMHVSGILQHTLITHNPERLFTNALLSGDAEGWGYWVPGESRGISHVIPDFRRIGAEALAWFHLNGRDTKAVAALRKRVSPKGIHQEVSTAGPACGHPAVSRAFRWCWARIQEGRVPSIQDVAAHMNMSARTLNRQFNQVLGKTARAFMLDMRMDRARQLLGQRTEWSIERVSSECGFEKQGSFSMAFRELFNLSPSEYRSQCQASSDNATS